MQWGQSTSSSRVGESIRKNVAHHLCRRWHFCSNRNFGLNNDTQPHTRYFPVHCQLLYNYHSRLLPRRLISHRVERHRFLLVKPPRVLASTNQTSSSLFWWGKDLHIFMLYIFRPRSSISFFYYVSISVSHHLPRHYVTRLQSVT